MRPSCTTLATFAVFQIRCGGDPPKLRTIQCQVIITGKGIESHATCNGVGQPIKNVTKIASVPRNEKSSAGSSHIRNIVLVPTATGKLPITPI